jgi:hypothetical protein
MKADFLPPSVVDIQEKEAICASQQRFAIALLQQLDRQVVQVAFEQGTTAIATAYLSTD